MRRFITLRKIIDDIDTLPRHTIIVSNIVLVILIGTVDYLTGPNISLSLFYLLPVAITAWFTGKSYGVMVSFISASAWVAADVSSGHPYAYWEIPVWNSVMRLGIFLIVAYSMANIKRLLDTERSLARIDPLTKVYNNRAFYELAQLEIDKFKRSSRPFSVAYIDIDDFKRINDQFGHLIGDDLLKVVGKTIKKNIRSIDIIARLGGDEFVLLMPETDDRQAKTAMTKVQTLMMDVVRQNKWSVTFSIGVITYTDTCNLNDLIKRADQLMYVVKKSGKNNIQFGTYGKPC